MIIPVGYAHVQHFFAGLGLPNGAAITYGVDGFGASTPEQAAEELHTGVDLHIMPLLTTSVTLVETRVKYGPNSTGPFGSFVEPVNGVDTATVVPPNTALLVEKRTALGGRTGRGRLYLPGISETHVLADGKISSAMQAAAATALDDWLTYIETNLAGMVILHNASSDPTSVTQLTVDPVAATQRRRLR